MYDTTILSNNLTAAEIIFSGCNSDGIVWDLKNNEIQTRPDVAAIIAAYNPDEIVIRAINQAVQNHLDATAQARGYDSMLSCVSYAASLMSIWSAEGQAACDWRDACWQRTFDIIHAGTPYPTPAEVVAQLPPMVWP